MKLKPFLITLIVFLYSVKVFAQGPPHITVVVDNANCACDLTICVTLIDSCTQQECDPSQTVCLKIPKRCALPLCSTTYTISPGNCFTSESNPACFLFDVSMTWDNCDHSDGYSDQQVLHPSTNYDAGYLGPFVRYKWVGSPGGASGTLHIGG